MNLEEKFKTAFKLLGYHLMDLKTVPRQFQKFLDSVPDFFIERQGSPASNDEAEKIISNFPQNIGVMKLLFGIVFQDEIIGFFEILLHFPSQEIISQENEIIKEKIGELEGNRFTIGYLVILVSHRNRGIGSKIIATIEKILFDEGYQHSHLVVNQNNVRAKHFYEKHGYQVIKETQQNINNRMQMCCIMIKNLK